MRVYVRPIAMIDSPQLVDGAALRLGGSLVWAQGLEISSFDGGRRVQRLVTSVAEKDAALAQIPAELRPSAQLQLAHIVRSHAPIVAGSRTIRLDQPQVMGILNVTPDSFSDGGRFVDDPQAAADAGFAMAEAGAAIIDIGGESTRPDAPSVWEGDEIRRIQPVIARLAASGTPISIDTRKAAVMQAGLAAGGHMINDVSALLHDDGSLAVAAASSVPVVLMHAPSYGADPHAGGRYDNVVTDVFDWLEARIAAAIAGGVARERIIVDPGIGFGKSLAENLALVNNLALFHALGQPILFGASRKRLIGALSNEAAVGQRLGGSLALAMIAMGAGAHIIRAHDVPETVQAVHVWRGLRDAALTAF